MQPYKEKVVNLREVIILSKEQLKIYRKEKREKTEIDVLEQKIDNLEKEIRKEEAIISDIEAKVFDLKAVNPNAVAKVDARTTMEIIENIEAQTKIITESMNNLKIMLQEQNELAGIDS